MKILTLSIIFILVLSSTTFAATCGNNNAEGSEQCDGTDIRDLECNTVHDYDNNLMGKQYGDLSCKSDCTFDFSECYNINCGDGDLRGLEECDDGQDNSDSLPNACRTDCTFAECGDGVTDNGEECDEGYNYNSDVISDKCRTNCMKPSCGDGVVDISEGEICDDGNTDTGDGCANCQFCYIPYDGMQITGYVKLCEGTYELKDEGSEGVIRMSGSSSTLDCNNAKIIGISTFATANTGVANEQLLQQGVQFQNQGQDSQAQQTSGFFSDMIMRFVNMFGVGDEPEEENPGNEVTGNTVGGNAMNTRTGTGVRITSQNNIMMNCDISNFRYGVKVNGIGNMLVNNKICDNNGDIKATAISYGAKNKCDTAYDWLENGVSGCTLTCDGSENTGTVGECPEYICEECQTCEVVEQEEIEEEIVETTNESTEEPEETITEPIKIVEKILCGDGTYVETIEECPQKIKCGDGTYVYDEELCPKKIICEDGSIVYDEDNCPQETEEEDYVVCPDGTKAKTNADCPIEESETKCWDGSNANTEEECPEKIICDDGSIVSDKEKCPQEEIRTEKILCDDGKTYVTDINDCPESTTITKQINTDLIIPTYKKIG